MKSYLVATASSSLNLNQQGPLDLVTDELAEDPIDGVDQGLLSKTPSIK
jgi:hypothetical protein